MTSVLERIDSLRRDSDAQSQAQLHEEKAEEIRQTRLSENQRKDRLSLFERLVGELGVREMFEEIVDGENLEGAEIKTILTSDLENAFLQLKWPGKKRPSEDIARGVLTPREEGYYSVRVGYNFEDISFVVEGKTQNLKQARSLSKLDTETVERAIATAYLYPDWRSSTTVQMAAETA